MPVTSSADVRDRLLEVDGRVSVTPPGVGSARRRLPAHWPLTALLVGFPLWWVLGLSGFLPILLAAPMAIDLLHVRTIRVPRGFGWWLLFLAFVLASSLTLWSDAPGAVPGGGPSRLVVYGYRLAWYLTCTIAMLWVINHSEQSVSTTRVSRLFGWMFVVTVAGGLAGVLAPALEFTSLMEAVLPRGLAHNGFVNSIIHPATANIQTFLGRPEARPIAPFAFANSWGSNLSLYLPFFLVSWFGKNAGWRRSVAPFILLVAVVPIVFSLNRGLWASLGVGLLFVLGRMAWQGRVVPLVSLALVGVLGSALFLLSPLGDLATERLGNAHSNGRRAQLLTQTVSSTLHGSPIVGFGSTRNVQGSFASIAGGSTADCPACGVPPLGTQGHIWLVIFSQGLVGALFFTVFFALVTVRHLRARTTVEAVGLCLLIFFWLQMSIYDTLGMPLFTIMMGIGLMWRERQSRMAGDSPGALARGHLPLPSGRKGTMVRSCAPVARRPSLVLMTIVCGAALGAIWAGQTPTVYSSGISLLLAPSPVYLSADVRQQDRARGTTVDTEAALAVSTRSLKRVRGAIPTSGEADLRSRIVVTAIPNTRILNLSVRDESAATANELAGSLAHSYLIVRGDFLQQRRDQLLRSMREKVEEHEPAPPPSSLLDPNVSDIQLRDDPLLATMVAPLDTNEELRTVIDRLSVSSTDAGEVIRGPVAAAHVADWEVKIASGALLGMLAGICLNIILPPRCRRRRAPAPRSHSRLGHALGHPEMEA